MEIKAKLGNLRVSPRKVRLVADLIRGKKAAEAEKILRFSPKKSARDILKLLLSAIANAENNFSFKKDNLLIVKIMVNDGPTLKRWRARAMGRANEIKKRTSQILLTLEAK